MCESHLLKQGQPSQDVCLLWLLSTVTFSWTLPETQRILHLHGFHYHIGPENSCSGHLYFYLLGKPSSPSGDTTSHSFSGKLPLPTPCFWQGCMTQAWPILVPPSLWPQWMTPEGTHSSSWANRVLPWECKWKIKESLVPLGSHARMMKLSMALCNLHLPQGESPCMVGEKLWQQSEAEPRARKSPHHIFENPGTVMSPTHASPFFPVIWVGIHPLLHEVIWDFCPLWSKVLTFSQIGISSLEFSPELY